MIRGARRRPSAGVGRLVVVDGGGKRDENGRQAGRRKFGDRERASSANHQVSPGIGLGHVFDERLQLDVDPVLFVGAPRVAACARRSGAEHRARFSGSSASAAGTTGSAPAHPGCHQAPAGAAALATGEAVCGIGDRGNVVAYRVADGFRVDLRIKTAREGLQHNPGKTRQKTVCQARDGILFVNHERPARQPGGQTAGTADEAAHAEHGGRAMTQHDSSDCNSAQTS